MEVTAFLIEGMTCSSCSSTIERGVSKMPGVISCRVILVLEKAIVEYDSNLVSLEEIQEMIEDLGFGAQVLRVDKPRVASISVEDSKFAKCVFNLDGLTCSSCTSAVEKAVKKVGGVMDDSVKVTLLPAGRLDVKFDNNICSAASIITAVEDIGFGIELVSSVNDADTVSMSAQPNEKQGYFRIEKNAFLAKDYLSHVEGVKRVSFNDYKKRGNKKIQRFKSATTLDEALFEDEQVIDEDAILLVVYDDYVVGLRQLLDSMQSSSRILANGGLGTVTVEDYVSFTSNARAASSKRGSEIRQWRDRVLFAAAFSIPVFLISMVFMHISGPKQALMSKVFLGITWEEFLTWVLSTPVQFISGWRFYKESYHSLKNGALGMSILIALGTSAAYAFSVFVVLYNAIQDPVDRLMVAFETSALLITFVLLGKYLEAYAKARTSAAISKLAQMSVNEACLLETKNNRDGTTRQEERKIPIALVQRGDILLVKPGEKVPTDGIVAVGTSTIDESMLTGESVPVHKEEGSKVIGATINLDGSLQIEVTHIGEDTALAQIVRLVEDAQTSKPPIQAFADKISSIFVPFVLSASLVTFVIWIVLLELDIADMGKYRDEGLGNVSFALLFGISVLVIACPCALGLATPTAVMVGTGVGAKNGILIKGGEPLEAANGINAVVFDKTGTLTMGQPTVGDVLLLSAELQHIGDMPPSAKDGSTTQVNQRVMQNVFYLAASAENGSEHPLAKGIMQKAKEYGIGNAEDDVRRLAAVADFSNEIGKGIKCTVDGMTVNIGNRKCIEANSISARPGTFDAMEFLENKGQTAVVLCVNGKTEAVIGLIDKAKDDAATTVHVLENIFKIKVYMLTGDNRTTARSIASSIGINPSRVIADVLPGEKADCIAKLQGDGLRVAMIGDGVNDSPALAKADVGIAIGAGTDVAIESAQVVLMNSKLSDVIVTFDLSRTIFKRIRLNFLWALGYNTLGIPIAAGALFPLTKVVVPPYVAAFAMALSSISVVSSSLLLNLYKPPKIEKKYGRDATVGTLGLQLIKYTSTSATEPISIRCRSMELGGPCLCPSDACDCTDCAEHNRTTRVEPVDEENSATYPGCQTKWGKPCCCGDKCQCGTACASKMDII